ncbi:unnamed protein product, partial [Rotaria magnacalcarata]
KKNEELVRKKITEYLDIWNKAGAQPVEQKKTTATNEKKVPTKRSTRKRALSSEDDDPNYDPNVVESEEPTFSKRKTTQSL